MDASSTTNLAANKLSAAHVAALSQPITGKAPVGLNQRLRHLARGVFWLLDGMLPMIAVVCLVLGVISATLWARCIWFQERISYDWARSSVYVWVKSGNFEFGYTWDLDSDRSSTRQGFSRNVEPRDDHFERMLWHRVPGHRLHFEKFRFAVVTGERWQYDHLVLYLPAWFLCGTFFLISLAIFVRMTCKTGDCQNDGAVRDAC